MKSSEVNKNNKAVEHGRVIARGMHLEKVQQEKNMMKAEKRQTTMLHRAAEKALSGNNSN